MTKRMLLLVVWILLGSSIGQAQNELDDNLSNLLNDYVNEDEPGVVLYLNYDGEEALVARGLADLAAKTPIREQDLFRLASISKSFVASVVLQLVAEDKIELDNRIADYLPDELVHNIANAQVATVRQVLQMTSGIYNYTDTDAYYDAIYSNPLHEWTAEETLTLIYDKEPYFAPVRVITIAIAIIISPRLQSKASLGILWRKNWKRVFLHRLAWTLVIWKHPMFLQKTLFGVTN